MAALLRQSIRATDLAGRLDGDRFAILILAWPLTSAQEIEERLAKATRVRSDLEDYAHCLGFEAGIGRRGDRAPCSIEALLLEAEEDRRRRTHARCRAGLAGFLAH